MKRILTFSRTISFRIGFLVSLVLILGAGCSSLVSSVFKAPKISNESLQVEELGLQKIKLALKMDVQNPNGYDLLVENLKAEILVRDQRVLSQHWKELPTLIANKSTAVELPFEVAWSDLLNIGFNVLTDKEVPYWVKGTLSVKGLEVPFDEKGRIGLRK
ncbi:MAG: LEA type 2 family protein [Bdellovibrio sp.]